jgi:hypothetical protein
MGVCDGLAIQPVKKMSCYISESKNMPDLRNWNSGGFEKGLTAGTWNIQRLTTKKFLRSWNEVI